MNNYTVGILQHPSKNDPSVTDVAEAKLRAETESREDWGTAYCVWEMAHYEIVCIAFLGRCYLPTTAAAPAPAAGR